MESHDCSWDSGNKIVKTRGYRRTCTNPAPSCGGASCQGGSYKSELCIPWCRTRNDCGIMQYCGKGTASDYEQVCQSCNCSVARDCANQTYYDLSLRDCGKTIKVRGAAIISCQYANDDCQSNVGKNIGEYTCYGTRCRSGMYCTGTINSPGSCVPKSR